MGGTGTLGGMVHVIISVVESVPMIQQATVCHKFGDFGFCHEVDQPMHLYNVTTVDNVNFSLMCHYGEASPGCLEYCTRGGRRICCRRPPHRVGFVNVKTGINYLTTTRTFVSEDDSKEWGCHVASPGDIVTKSKFVAEMQV